MNKVIEIIGHRVKKADKISSWLYSKAQLIMDQAANHLQYVARVMPEFDLHDSSHSEEVLDIIEKVAGTSIRNLSTIELFFIIASSYLHDCGMALSDYEVKVMSLTEGTKEKYLTCTSLKNDGKKCLTYVEAIEVIKQNRNLIYQNFEGDIRNWLFVPSTEEELIRYLARLLVDYQEFRNKNYATIKDCVDFAITNQSLRVEYIRSTHHKRVSEYIKNFGKTKFADFPISGLGQQIANDLASICEAHGEFPEYICKLKHQIVYCGNYSCNLQYLAMLLRIGDIVHFDYNRAPLELRSLHQFHSEYSYRQWRMKTGVNFSISKRTIFYSAFVTIPADYYNLQNYIDWIDDELKLFLQLSAQWDQKYKLSIKEKVDRSNITYDSSAFTPVIGLKFTLDQNRILKLLMGTSLYKDENAYIRELYQNSLDACRYQIAKDKANGKKSRGIIEFGIVEEDGEKYLYCLDNGKGMSKSIIENYLLKIGNSYYKSSEFFKSQAETGFTYIPTSQFGIGILSCFMIGKRIEIVSKEDQGDYIACSIDGPSEYFYYKTPSEYDKDLIANSGTIIKVYLQKEHYDKYNTKEIDRINIVPFVFSNDYLLSNTDFSEEYNAWKNSLFKVINDYIRVVPEDIDVLVRFNTQKKHKIISSPNIYTSGTLSETDMDILDHRRFHFRKPCEFRLKDYINYVECYVFDIKHQGIQYKTVLKLPKPGIERYGYEVMKYIPIIDESCICVDGVFVEDHGLDYYSSINTLKYLGIVNFYGENRPQLSVDRKSIVNWAEDNYESIAEEIVRMAINEVIKVVHQHIHNLKIQRGSEIYNIVWRSVFHKFSKFSNIMIEILSQSVEKDIEWSNLSLYTKRKYTIGEFIRAKEVTISDYNWSKFNDVSQVLILNKLYAASEIKVDMNTISIKSNNQYGDKILSFDLEDNVDSLIYLVCATDYDKTFAEYDIISNLYPLISDNLFSHILIYNEAYDLNNHIKALPDISNGIAAFYTQNPKEIDEELGLYMEENSIFKQKGKHIRTLNKKRGTIVLPEIKLTSDVADKRKYKMAITVYIAPQNCTEDEAKELEFYKDKNPSYCRGVKEGWSIIVTGEYDEKSNIYIKAGKCTRKDLVQLIPSSFWEKYGDHIHIFPDGTKVKDYIDIE